MSQLNWVDVVVAFGVVLVGLAGWRSGVIATVAAFVGFVGGSLLGAWLMPQLLADVGWPAPLLAVATLGGILVLGLLGQSILGMLGRAVRDVLAFRPVRLLDSASGMVVSAVAFLLGAWLVLSVAASVPQGSAAEAVRSSRAYTALDQVMAGPGGRILDDARALLDRIDLPSLPVNPATLPPVADPSGIDVPSSVVAVARESVVRVSATSTECGVSMMGSGVVVGPQRVVTNAHVVAGADRISVREPSSGGGLGARLVYRDSATDLAVLFVPGLDAPAPAWRASVPRGTEGAVAGYPGGGVLRVRPARVRGTTTVQDDGGGGTREVVVLRGVVQPGNSGGAVLGLDGRVIGLVFANSTLDDTTGFALAPDEVLPVVRATRGDTAQVSSGACRAA